MKKIMAAFSLVAILCGAVPAFAGALDQGKQMMSAGDLSGAAEFFNRYAVSNPGDSAGAPEALAMAGRILDAMADSLTGQAEKSCYWNKGNSGSPACMQRFADQYNARFGDGAFRYEHAVTFIVYTGSHYRILASKYPKSAFAPEADFYLLLRELVGHPDIVLPKIKAYLAKYPSGEWNRRGLLLWARVNEDVWYVHRKWSWVLFNNQLSMDDLIIKAEPYRQEALRTYEKLMKDPNTFEGKSAAREYALLKDQKEDGITYSIVNDSNPGLLSAWGIAQPAAPRMDMNGNGGAYPAAPSAAPAAKGAPAAVSAAPVQQAPAAAAAGAKAAPVITVPSASGGAAASSYPAASYPSAPANVGSPAKSARQTVQEAPPPTPAPVVPQQGAAEESDGGAAKKVVRPPSRWEN